MPSVDPFCWTRRVAVRDVDAFQIVWYGNYLAYCDEARAELLRAFDLPPASFPELGYYAVVVESRTRHHASARFDDLLQVHTRLNEMRGSRLRFTGAVRRAADRELLALVETTVVVLKQSGELVYFVPPPIKAALERLLEAQPAEDP